jgi:hypothetical protein
MGKKLSVVMSALLFVSSLLVGLAANARVTEKVNAMIAENTPLKVNDNDFSIQAGGPLVLGVQYDRFATANVAMGGGIGSYLNGTSMDLAIKFFLLPGRFSPFISGGPVFYYSSPHENIFAIFGSAGLSYYFADGLGFSVAFAYVKSLTESLKPFSYYQINDEINWPSIQLGLHWNY